MPGASFIRDSLKWRQDYAKMIDLPFRYATDQIVSNTIKIVCSDSARSHIHILADRWCQDQLRFALVGEDSVGSADATFERGCVDFLCW